MKNNTAKKTTFSELKFLDDFFKEHGSDMSVVKAHGFITAVVSFPDLYLPREWLPILVSDLKSQPAGTAKAIIDGLINIFHLAWLRLLLKSSANSVHHCHTAGNDLSCFSNH